MRITEGSMMRNYFSSLNKNLKNLSGSNEKLSSGSKYRRVSDNISQTARALVIREQLNKNEQYQSNIGFAEDELSSAESSLSTINEVLQTAQERVLRGISGSYDDVDRKIIGSEVKSLKEQVLLSINAKFGSRFLFGNSNNSEAPFTEGGDGRLLYNGIDVDQIFKDAATDKLMYPNPSYDSTVAGSVQYLAVPENKDVYIDAGLGVAVSGDNVNTKTAIKLSTSGIEAIGFGMTLDTSGKNVPNNLFNLLNRVAQSFENNDLTGMKAYSDQLTDQKNGLMMSISEIGSRTNFLAQISNRIDNDTLNLQEKQRNLEGVDTALEAINNKVFETSWLVNLQLGSQILPTSIFDFIR